MSERIISIAASGDDDFWGKEGTTAEWPPSGTASSGGPTDIAVLARKARLTIFSDLICGFLRFDTSVIPDDDTVTAATLRVQCTALGLTTRNLVVGYYASSNWPIDETDWSGADNPGSDAGTFALSVFGAGTQEDLALTNVSSISKSGFTGFRLALDGGQPVAIGDDHRLQFASLDHTTVAEPQLIVVYVSAVTYKQFPKPKLALAAGV